MYQQSSLQYSRIIHIKVNEVLWGRFQDRKIKKNTVYSLNILHYFSIISQSPMLLISQLTKISVSVSIICKAYF